MGLRLHYPSRSTPDYAATHRHPTNLLLHLIAVPLFIVASLLLLIGLLGASLLPVVLGVIGLVAALALQRQGHKREEYAVDAHQECLQEVLLEQFVTFPRFVLSGGWWRAWKRRRP
ncbi:MULTISPECIES: Mpo1-like protein [Pseudomonas]|uniref:Mpo1-like protein n=1 Tax=Pseudomonas TaxID=286 RepID=UPI00249AABEB|nr:MULTISPECIES: Mpo1-like protein [Pseudomonas]